MSSAKEFGAIGDGQADDTAAIQHAINDGEGVVEFPKGIYRITRSLQLDTTRHGYLGLRGAQGTARLVMTSPGPAVVIRGDHQGTATPSTVAAHTWDGERFPVVSGLEIVGEHPETDGIMFIRTMQATLQNILVRKCRNGVVLSERNRNFVISSSHIYDCHDTGLLFDKCNLHQVIIHGNHISYCRRAGIRQSDGDVHNIQITGNDIEYNSGSDTDVSGEIVLEAPKGVISEYTIAGNTLQATLGARGANVLVLGKTETPASSVRLIAITGNVLGSRDRNVVVHNGMSVNVTGNTIYGGQTLNVAFKNCHQSLVGSNTIASRPASWASTSADGLLMEDCNACTLIGNIHNGCRFGDALLGGSITVRNSRNISISGCQINNSAVRGIDISNSVQCRISDNSLHNDGTNESLRQAIRIAGTSFRNIVQNNSIVWNGIYPKGVSPDGRRPAQEGVIECSEKCGRVLANSIW
ncbi:MAG TPA: right-handed parallel beta-helix repeat-containing protein [Pirellulaceae bacterium]|nr:right-handed parallel beta-helix repeat-containing protein [Pirellulaceae bacterium]